MEGWTAERERERERGVDEGDDKKHTGGTRNVVKVRWRKEMERWCCKKKTVMRNTKNPQEVK